MIASHTSSQLLFLGIQRELATTLVFGFGQGQETLGFQPGNDIVEFRFRDFGDHVSVIVANGSILVQQL